MTEYTYKGFKIHYEVRPLNPALYQAEGHIVSHGNKKASSFTKKFQTEYHTAHGVQDEIKKMIEQYINFEWKECLDIKKEEL